MPAVKSSLESWTLSLIERMYNAIRRGNDISRNVTLTGSLTALTAEKCAYTTIINTTGADVTFSVNNTAPVTLPNKSGVTIDVVQTSDISVSGSGTLAYIVSK